MGNDLGNFRSEDEVMKNAIGSAVRKRAMSYPHVTEEFPWGESAFKVKGKTFVFMREEKDAVSFSVKLQQSRDFALTLPGSSRRTTA